MRMILRHPFWAMVALLAACSSTPDRPDGVPKNQGNACSVLQQRDGWGEALVKAQRKWHAPPSVVMAIIWRESSFRHDARPLKKTASLSPFSSKYASSAYGYSQALNGTWKWYQDETGSHSADRGDFDDAVDFVGWYLNKTQHMTGLRKTDAFNQYLAYHEGQTGYNRGDWRRKSWLMNAASQVQNQADRYRAQLAVCPTQLS